MDDLSLEKIEISGPTLASLIQRASSSPSDIDGLIFGQINRIVSSNLHDDSPAESSCFSSEQLVATVKSFLCSGKTVSFYDSLGKIDPRRIDFLRDDSPDRLLGWFSARRRTVNRPSMREISVASSLASQFHLPIDDLRDSNSNSTKIASCMFFLLTTPSAEQVIHTHEYRAYQFRSSSHRLEPRSVAIVNIGPAFRGHYSSFSPKSRFPPLLCEMRSSAMSVDRDEGSLSAKKQAAKDQKEIDALSAGFQVRNLNRLVGAEAANYTGGIEDVYERMLAKIEFLACDVENSSAMVIEQDKLNRKLRYRVAGIE